MSVSCCGFDLEEPTIEGEKRDVKGSTSKVEDQHVPFSIVLLVKAISDGCSCRLIDNSENLETSNSSSIFGGLPLAVVEIGWDSDNCILDSFSEISFGSFLHFGENHGGDLLWLELLDFSLALDHNHRLVIVSCFNLEGPVLDILLNEGFVKLPADQSFGIKDGVGRIPGNLVLGCISDQSFSVSEGNIRRSGSVALIVGDDLNSIILPDPHTGVGGSQVDSNGFA